MKWYLLGFKRYADFSGRSRRTEYWMFNLFNALILFGMVFLSSAIGLEDYASIPIALYVLVILIPSLALTIRRLHDSGKSGWYILVRLIPVIGGIWYLVLMCTGSEYNANLYGPNPKQPVDNELNEIGVAEV